MTILAIWLGACALVVACAARFGRWLDGKSDPDRVTRWNREAVHSPDDTDPTRLGLTPRRVVQLRGREVLPRPDEAVSIRERFRRHLAHEAARLEQEAIALRRRRDAIG